ncbi:hypothetical protein RIF29_30173 [Crotalaria pallida]|uniref:Nuclear transcription factor Y subunit n=1 Tax=Crotalaria pallida TaxID=3830 RepID=A0AAN9EHZ2_CROPI
MASCNQESSIRESAIWVSFRINVGQFSVQCSNSSACSAFTKNGGKSVDGLIRSSVGSQDFAFPPSQLGHNQSLAHVSLHHAEPCFSGLLAAYGLQSNPYLHESRHLHALKRARGSGGRFLNTKKLQESKLTLEDHSLDVSSYNTAHSSNSFFSIQLEKLLLLFHWEVILGSYTLCVTSLSEFFTSQQLIPQHSVGECDCLCSIGKSSLAHLYSVTSVCSFS